MPLDKSRIEGFGSGGASSSTSTAAVKGPVTKCPAGHTLQKWAARQGSCDGCGRFVRQGEQVMDCRQCNWYLCYACHEHGPQGQNSSLWGAISSVTDGFSTPAVQSALDTVALRVGDVIDAAAQDMSELGTEIKTFVNSSLGFKENDEEEPTEASSALGLDEKKKLKDQKQKQIHKASEEEEEEAKKVVSTFMETLPATRVAPKASEMETFSQSCGLLKSSAVVAAFCDQLSFANGDYSWQPRLRVLYTLEFFHNKGGSCREISSTVAQQAGELIGSLVEVPQCKEKASQVLALLSGTTKEEPKAQNVEAKPQKGLTAAPRSSTSAAPAQDLLGEPDHNSMSGVAAGQAKAAPFDLLSLGEVQPAQSALVTPDLLGGSNTSPAPVVVDNTLQTGASWTAAFGPDITVGAAQPAKPAASQGFGGPVQGFGALGGLGNLSGPSGLASGMSSNKAPSLGTFAAAAPGPFVASTPTSFPGRATDQFVGATTAPAAGSLANVWASGGLEGLSGFGSLNELKVLADAAAPANQGVASGKAAAGRSPAVMLPSPGLGQGGGPGPSGPGGRSLPYIPAASELTPLTTSTSQDAFAFVAEHTGIDKGKA